GRSDRRCGGADRDGAGGRREAGYRRGARGSEGSCVVFEARSGATLGSVRSFNLRQVRLRSGEEFRDEVELEQEPFELGGERYIPVPEKVPAELVIQKASTGTVFELRFTARLHGPCYRCLGDAVLEVPIDAREYQATNPP